MKFTESVQRKCVDTTGIVKEMMVCKERHLYDC